MQASIKAEPTFEANVETRRPGMTEPLKFIGIFKHRTRDEFAALIDGARENPKGDVESVLDVLTGWKGLQEEFSKENVAVLVQNFHEVAGDIANTYIRELGPARLGN